MIVISSERDICAETPLGGLDCSNWILLLVRQEQPDIVSVTTAAPDRADVVIGLAESGCVKAIYATKPISVSLAEADAMIEACHQHNVIFALACHKNWSPWFQACLQAIEEGEIGQFRSMFVTCG